VLSWRVAILPYLDEKRLYDRFRLDEPWDGPTNKKLLAEMPQVFRAPGQAGSDETHYQGFAGPRTLFEPGVRVRMSDVTDGLSNTLLVTEAEKAVPWAKPEDLPYDPKKPLPKLGGISPGRFHAAFADGAVHTLAVGAKESALRLAITRNDGQELDWNLLSLRGVIGSGPVAAAGPDARDPRQSVNNLKQIVLALHNYHDVHHRFPGNLTDNQGQPVLSWRVAILPYLDEKGLYDRFRLDEPWDGPTNKKLLAEMPQVFRAPGQPAGADETHYQGFAGPGTMFEPGVRVRTLDVTDGTSNTLFVTEAEKAVPWAKPEDLPYDPKKPLPKLGGITPDGIHAGFVDGAAHTLRYDVKPRFWHDAITRNGGEILDWENSHPPLPRGGAAAARPTPPAPPTDAESLRSFDIELEKEIRETRALVEEQKARLARLRERTKLGEHYEALKLAEQHALLTNALTEIRIMLDQVRAEIEKLKKAEKK
jgi:hypothetical protein